MRNRHAPALGTFIKEKVGMSPEESTSASNTQLFG